MSALLQLAWAFFKVGVVSFGGGWSIVGLIRDLSVSSGWISDAGFREVVALAQVTPGPVALNAATLVGWRVAGLPGALVATVAVLAFPLLCLVLVTWALRKLPLDQERLAKALRLVSLALVASTLLSLVWSQDGDPVVIAIGAASCALVSLTKLDPTLIILGAGALGAVLFPLLGLA